MVAMATTVRNSILAMSSWDSFTPIDDIDEGTVCQGSDKRCHGNDFLAFCVIWGAHWHHLANTTELSVCSGDAVLCQITLLLVLTDRNQKYRQAKTEKM